MGFVCVCIFTVSICFDLFNSADIVKHKSIGIILLSHNCSHIDFAGHHKRRVVIALYNYTAREDTDVSFVKGDRMEVLDDTESDWWRVIHLTTRQEGLIPWNFVAEERSVNSEEYVHHFVYFIVIL